ncbi:hypothetical protein [Metapseudomonas otitidis]|uniref:hypothetical protein n=1 Tax=Metapseudomonas otitidis TaxID=319939 RepID=UPI0008E5AED3|nr:hypothetical protein [Pseudomonas otitidis]SFA65500.1 Uncharacterized protein YaaW, UPF0174 family [Pseudomonas otitidis]
MTESKSAPLIGKNLTLGELLKRATPEELTALVDIVIGQESERYFHDDSARQKILQCRNQGALHTAINSIASEVCALGSNTIASAFRRGGSVSYDEVVRDVAKELKVEVRKGAAAPEVEHQLLEELLSKVLEGKSEQEKDLLLGHRVGAVDAAVLSSARQAAGGTSVASQLLDRLDPLQLSSLLGGKSGLVTSGAALALLVGLRAVPVVGALTAGFSALSALKRTAPALTVIVPAVVQIAFIRRRIIHDDYEKFFSQLRACL